MAVNAANGTELWRFKPEGRPAFRGLIYWPGTSAQSRYHGELVPPFCYAMARGFFAEADRTERRMREHDARHIRVVEPRIRHAAEQPIGESPTGGDRNRRQREASGHVADRVDAGHVRILPFVGFDIAGLDVGGGFPAEYGHDPNRKQVEMPSLGQIMSRLSGDLKEYQFDQIPLVAEPGRVMRSSEPRLAETKLRPAIQAVISRPAMKNSSLVLEDPRR